MFECLNEGTRPRDDIRRFHRKTMNLSFREINDYSLIVFVKRYTKVLDILLQRQ